VMRRLVGRDYDSQTRRSDAGSGDDRIPPRKLHDAISRSLLPAPPSSLKKTSKTPTVRCITRVGRSAAVL